MGGGYEDPVKVVSSLGRNTVYLKSTHEKADTRILLHAADTSDKGYRRIIIQCRDTDVLVLLVVFLNHDCHLDEGRYCQKARFHQGPPNTTAK